MSVHDDEPENGEARTVNVQQELDSALLDSALLDGASLDGALVPEELRGV